ncbi:hypothetical protein EVG20_g2700 [Dentipellis fragilis]|uniref:Uncharacterized protein n=1 Tax=Dentipellis fragilis TaxID=205917 RepID=A0A4Y9Z615_9AGAM|nr:hypothetical protein EVG20_g2700 [Dentipellis fragilis]
MSVPSYRLETPRRPPPPPLRLNSGKRSSSLAGKSNPTSEPLLYDLPSATPLSPPGTSPSRVTSPTSPSYAGRSRIRVPRSRRSSPQPSRARSATPSRVMSDLEDFAEHCRQWYFNQDEEAGRVMTRTLATLPPSQRAPYAKLQGSIRAAYHASVNARRTAEFRAHLSATTPGASLMPHSRADPHGPLARKERLERFDRFVRSWCTMGMPGTKPFFEGLWAVLRLQVVPGKLGGAGSYRIEWEIDDAVFQEAAGKDFMLEAIDVLKGVLAFEESPSKRASSSCSNSRPASPAWSLIHSRSQSQPLSSKPPVPARRKAAPLATPTHAKRPRAPSDPFLDTPTPSRSYTSSTTQSTLPLSASPPDTVDDPPSPITPPAEADGSFRPMGMDYMYQQESEEAYMRVWTSPDLSNPEVLELLKVFPTFISRRALPRFSESPASRRPNDIEEGQEASALKDEIRIGTGRMWVSARQRAGGWDGGWWARFVLWWKRIFC